MQTCPECGGEARDTHSFCPNCRTPLSEPAKQTARNTDRGGSSDDGDATAGNGMDVSRRNLLLYGGAAVGTAAVGGGAGFLLLSGGDGPGPAATARSFVEALDDGNVEDAREMLHPDSELQDGGLEFVAGVFEQAEIEIDATEVVSEDDTSAEVRIETTATVAGETQSDAAIITLRTQGGEWRVMNFESA